MGQPQKYLWNPKKKTFLKSEKIFQFVVFSGNHSWKVYQISKTVASLDKIIESTNVNPKQVYESKNCR